MARAGVRAGRIAVDLTPLIPGGGNGGAASIVLDLVPMLAADERELLLYVLPRSRSMVAHLVGPRVRAHVVRPLTTEPPWRGGEPGPWPPPWSLSRALGADLLYCPFGDPQWAEPGLPTVCATFDVQHHDHPEFFTEEELAHRRDYLDRMVAVADRVVVPTAWTRSSVLRHLDVDEARVEVVPLAGRTLPSPAAPGAAVPPVDGPYVLYPANAWPHKNHERLLDAMAGVVERARVRGDEPLQLVCTGSMLDRARALEERAAVLGIDRHVRFLGHVDDDVLGGLYRGARAVVFPSVYEGFGMPVLEAMAAGVPVACSDSAALPEVAGDAALLFDATDPAAIAEAVDRATTDEALRAELLARAPARLAHYSLDGTAAHYLATFDAVVREHAASRAAPAPAERLTFSAVMPSYRQAAFIERSIHSVLDQDVPVDDFIVCDGGSVDGTVEILERHAGRLDYVSEPDDGQAAAVNKGVAKVGGDVIGWLNSDDIWYPDAVEVSVTVLGRHPDLDFVYFAADFIDADDAILEPYYDRPWDAAAFRDSCFICQPATFIRRSAFLAAGGLDESLQFCMDYELWLRMARSSAPVYVPVVVAASRLHEETKTLGQRPAVTSEILRMLQRTLGQVPDWWILGWACAQVDATRDWDRSQPDQDRAYHRAAFVTSLRGYARLRQRPAPDTAETLKAWARHGWRRDEERATVAGRLGSLLPAPVRKVAAFPYHSATRWVRRRTLWELEPRIAAIEHRLAALAEQLADESSGAGVRREDEVLTELHRIVLAHHAVEEDLVDRVTTEVADLRRLVEDLRRGDG